MVPTSPRPFVFVLMPFDKSFDDTTSLESRPRARPPVPTANAWTSRCSPTTFLRAS